MFNDQQFVYLPLESYKERYTSLMSTKGGWIEDKIKKHGIDFIRIEGDSITDGVIKTGVVLDFFGRAHYSLTQNARVVKMINDGIIKDNAILYYEDFWTPGIDGVKYASELAGIKLNIYAMIHAQSVDKFDFIAKLKYWVRHYEIGQSKFMKGIFVTSEYLLDLCEEAGLENVYFGGLPYNQDFIEKMFPVTQEKQDQVVFSSRFDDEKNPGFFIEVAKKLNHKYKFVMTTSASEIRSNSPEVLKQILEARDKGIITVKSNLSKTEYYEELQKSKYQFNCALQDWLSWTMLEAITFKCIPIYPMYRSFPEYLPPENLYIPKNVDSAVSVIESNPSFKESLSTIPAYFDKSFDRYIQIIEKTCK